MTIVQLAALVRGIAPAIRDAISTATADLERRVKAAEDRVPQPGKDGAPGAKGDPGPAGKDGRDGVGFDDLGFAYDEKGRLELVFKRGDVEKRARVPSQVYRGVWDPSDAYEVGDVVTYGGSMHVARTPSRGELPTTSKAWQLSVKSGRDGRNGKDGAPGPEGPPGRPGLDLTQLDSGGKAWR